MPSSSRAPDDSRGLPVLLDSLEEIRESILREMRGGKNKKHPDQLSPSSLQYKVYLACRIKTRWGAPELCRYFAQDLVRELGPHWHQSEFYQWARENAGSKTPFEHSSEEECLGLVRRNSKKPKVTTEVTTEASGSVKQRVKQLGGNHWETPPEPAGKQPPRKRGRPSGKSASLRPSLGNKKRPREDEGDDEDGSEMDIDEIDPSKKTAKKSKYFSDDNGDEDDVDDAGASSAAEDDDDDDDDDDEQGGAATDSGSGSRLVLRAEKLPSTTPKGPNGTWTCEEPGCGHVVRAADEKDGQNLIRAHYEEHEQEARDESEAAALKRVNLAKQEAGRNMPIEYVFPLSPPLPLLLFHFFITCLSRPLPCYP